MNRTIAFAIAKGPLGYLFLSLAVSSTGCAVEATDTDSIEELSLGLSEDECDTTTQCRSAYGAAAVDCQNSQSDASVCICDDGQPCRSSSPIHEPSPTPSQGFLLENIQTGQGLRWTNDADDSTTESCGGSEATNVLLSDGEETSPSVHWSFEPAADGYIYVVASANGKVLQATNQEDAAGGEFQAVRMVPATCDAHWTQWKTVDAGDGSFRLESRAFGLWLQGSDVSDSQSSGGTRVRLVPTSFAGNRTKWRREVPDDTTDPGSPTDPSDPNNPAVYTGQTHWDAQTGTLTYLESGRLPNTHHGWNVPASVKTIVIAAGVRMNGRFDVAHDITIRGENRGTSVLFGTNEQGYNKSHDGCGECKSAVRGEGDITVTVKNLTSLNPYGFHFTGKRGARFVIDSVHAIDDRGGAGNNSDGVSAAHGTVVRNSYFESGDDIIKVYADIEVINTTIRMVTNTVPIQFGWGSYGSGARGVFRNLKVVGDGGRHNADNALISARQGHYDKSILIDGLDYRNPNGTVMIFREATGSADIEIKNALIDVRNFRGSSWSMNVDPEVCGAVYPDGRGAPNFFDCR